MKSPYDRLPNPFSTGQKAFTLSDRKSTQHNNPYCFYYAIILRFHHIINLITIHCFPLSPCHLIFFQKHLVSRPPGLGNHALELVDLGLGAAKGAELLLGELAGALVLAVAQQFDDAALVGGEAGEGLARGISTW